ncbi:flagellar motor switch protein FliG [Shouchella sp. JSM 1781072]|uniref:flagellar motor switch protein FliG n=1 Tax=Bacillaceae TaxID=186817 RepID=UPI000C089D36|nr:MULTISPECIES: flagellar motor switch protein FliG [Bacillaceae]UTR04772.1 flagellar motor switch protein FliG [Alkalihalobacillus sp. LMS6]
MAIVRLTGKQKAAILLISLGPDSAAQVYKHLTEEEIELLSLEISAVRKVDKDIQATVLEEFHAIVSAQDYIAQGGIAYARSILEKALGEEGAASIMERLTSTIQVRPFDFARKLDPSQILNFIQHEHPQTIAVILAYIPSKQAGQIISSLPEMIQTDVARRIAMMDRSSPEVISQVERVLEEKLSQTISQDYTEAGGIEAVVEVLNGVDRSTERTILDGLYIQDPELAEEIKKRMFVFEDIVTLEKRAIQRVIREVENDDLQLALKVASEDVKESVFSNMSQRMSEAFRDEMEYMGPVRLRDVEEAQSRIVAKIRDLEDIGEIVIARTNGEDILV